MAKKTTKKCFTCERELPKTEEYWYMRADRPGQIRTGRCKECTRKYQRTYQKNTDPDNLTSQPSRIYQQTYKFGSVEQKEITHEILTTLGYTWNGKFWWKPGYREEDGHWSCIDITKVPKTGSYTLTEKEVLYIQSEWKKKFRTLEDIQSEFNVTEGKAFGALKRGFKEPKLLPLRHKFANGRYPNGQIRYDYSGKGTIKPYRPNMSEEEKLRVVQLRKEGLTIPKICKEFNRSEAAIKYTLRKYAKE